MTGMRQVWAQSPGDIEMLLPWYAAGALNPRDIRRVEQALAGNPGLARLQALIREEYAATLDFNESLGVPSPRALQSLFEAIDKEPARKPSMAFHLA